MDGVDSGSDVAQMDLSKQQLRVQLLILQTMYYWSISARSDAGVAKRRLSCLLL